MNTVSKNSNSGSSQSYLAPIAVFLVSAVLSAGVIWRIEHDRQSIEHSRVLNIAHARAHLLQSSIDHALSATYAVAALIRHGKGTFSDFAPTVSKLLPFYPGVSSLDLAPGGVISAIFPLAGNEKAIGFDILNDPIQKKEALMARDSGKMTLAGPLNLVEGGLGAIGRLPVFLDRQDGARIFWGFTCVVLKFPDVLAPAGLDELVRQGYMYELWKIHPDSGKKLTITTSSTTALVDPVEYSLDLPNGTWTLGISPAKGWADPRGVTVKAIMGMMVSLIMAFTTFLLIQLKAHKHDLEKNVFLRTAELEKEVSERKQVAQELLEQSEYNRSLLDSISSNVAILNKDGVIVSVNNAWLMFARANNCHTGRQPCNSDVGANYLAVCQKAMAENESYAREAYEGVTSVINGSSQLFKLDYLCNEPNNATQRWFCMTVEPLKISAGGAVVTHDDISARKQIENELRQSETKLRTIYDSTTDAVMLLDETGFIHCNKATLRIFGCATREEFCSKHPADLSPPEQPCGTNSFTLAGQKISTAMELGSLHFEWVHMRNDTGATFPADVMLSAMVLDGKQVLQSSVRDISERKQVEAALKISEQRYRFSLEVTGQIGWSCLPDGQIEDAPMWRQFTGQSLEEVEGFKWLDAIHPEDRESTNKAVSIAIAQKCDYSTEYRLRRADGVYRNFMVRGIPLFNADGSWKEWVGTCIDITDLKKAEEEKLVLEQQFHQAQKLESLGVLAGGIAHDFNNILTVIMGHCFMAKEDFIPEAEYKAAFLKIETAGNRAADLCRQMLTYAGKSPMIQTRVNLWLLVDEVVKMLQSAIKKNVTIELDLKNGVPEINGDTAQIQQIIMNLVINAADAIGEANGTIRVVLTKLFLEEDQAAKDMFGTSLKSGRYACLEVADTGSGMDEETQKRIFEPFFTTKITGRGLGMSAIQGIVKAHDGILHMTSIPGVGTTFKVFFPAPQESDNAEASSTTVSKFEKTGGTILLVEDEETLLVMGETMLKAMGFSALAASNGCKALEIYRERGSEIDVILLDMIMPVMGGRETYHELRKISQIIPIIICSGYGVESVEDIITKDPYAGFLHKPYNPLELRDAAVKMMVNREVKSE